MTYSDMNQGHSLLESKQLTQGRRSARAGLRHTLVAATILASSAGLALAQPTSRPGTTPPAGAPAALQAPVAAQSAPASSANPAVTVLMERASFWRNQAQYDQALESLNRALALEPNNADALAMVGQIQAQRGNKAAADAALAKLRQAAPGDTRIDKIDQAIKIGPIPQDALTDARRLSHDGRLADAVDRYNRVFHGNPPPDNLAVEYYQTLAGTDGGWEKARDGLGRTVRENPQDLRAQLAYAQILTYRDGSRQEGIDRLQALSKDPSIADSATQAWRQALGWLPQNKAAVAPINTYLATHPNDADIASKLETARNPPPDPNDPGANARVTGFEALNKGQLADAATNFQAALAANPKDADATGGLGVVRLRQHKLDDARQLLTHAIELDPSSRARWSPALNGVAQAVAGSQPNPAVALMGRGNYAAAEADLQRQIAGGSNDIGLRMMLADAQARQGKTAAAEQTYRDVLARNPRSAPAMVGLAGILGQQGRHEESRGLLQQAEALGGNPANLAQARAQQLREQATMVSDPVTQAGLYRAALAADPSNAWIRLDYARALFKQGMVREARAVMADAMGPHASVDALRAGIIFATETSDPDAAAALLAQLPASARTPDIQAVQVQVDLKRQIGRVIDLPRTTARARLLALAAQPDPDGGRGATIARALYSIGDVASARRAIIISRDSTPTQGNAARLAYAGALLEIGDATGAQTMLAPLGYGGSLAPDQKKVFLSLREGLAIRSADDLNGAGKQAAAYDRLAPALASDPDNTDMNLALARLYSGASDPREALEINQALLRRDPANSDARRGAVAAALQLGNRSLAAQLVKEGLEAAPDDPKSWMASADYARSTGNNTRALRDLARARELRLQQLGYSDNGSDDSTLADVSLSPGAPATSTYIRQVVKLAAIGSNHAPTTQPPLYGNSDRGQDATESLSVPPPGYTQQPPTPLAPTPAAPQQGPIPAVPQQAYRPVLDTSQTDTLPAPRRVAQAASYQAASSSVASSADQLNAQQLNAAPAQAPAYAPSAPAYAPAPRPVSAPSYAAPGYSPPSYPPVTSRPSGVGQYVPAQYAQPQYAQPAAPQSGYSQTYSQPQAVAPGAAPVYPGYLPPVQPSGQPYQAQVQQVSPDARYQPQVQEYLPQYRPAPPPSAAQQVLEDDAQFMRGGDFEKPYRPYLPKISGDETVPFGRTTADNGPTNFYDNPFRRSPDDALRASAGLPAGNGVSGPDPVTQEIDRSIVALRDNIAPSFTAGVDFRSRSGDTGLDRLTEISAPLEATFSPAGHGELKITVTPTNATSGSIGGTDANLQRFGTLALGLTPPVTGGNTYVPAIYTGIRPGSQYAQGVGVDIGYSNGLFAGDVGSTPLGFLKTNIVGGIILSPQVTDHTKVVLTLDRRAVTDSVLAYAGTTDPRTGVSWGAVVRDRAKLALEVTQGLANFYIDGSGSEITGQNVESNSQYEAGAGGSYPIFRQGDEEIRVGLDLFFESYSKKLRFFTEGQGGYFSPQSYASALIPLIYRGKVEDNVTYEIGGAIGLQSFSEKASNYYPTSSSLQTQLNDGPQWNGLITQYPTSSSTGLAGNIHGKLDYLVTPNLHLGGLVSYQHSGNYDEWDGGLYLRYVLNGTKKQ